MHHSTDELSEYMAIDSHVLSDCHVKFWPITPLSLKSTADIDVFVELCKQVSGQFHVPIDVSQPLAFEIFCMSKTPRYGHVKCLCICRLQGRALET